jgi:protein-tyrosine phosphatase
MAAATHPGRDQGGVMPDRPRSVLFVCTGNICRSPTAHGLLAQEARRLDLPLIVDSAGTSDEERGRLPDRRARLVAEQRGWTLPAHRARVLAPADFERFELIVPMARQHELILRRRQPPGSPAAIRLFMSFAPELGRSDVPDPWFGDLADFNLALDLIEAGIGGMLRELVPVTPR